MQRTELEVSIGDKTMPVGRVTHVQDATRVFTQFAYAPTWLNSPRAFAVSPELALLPGTHIRKPKSRADSCFFYALADTAAGDWGRQIIARAHESARKALRDVPPLTEVDALLAVNDPYRLGALRLTQSPLPWWPELTRHTPLATLEDLPRGLSACWAHENKSGFGSDLAFLMAHGVSLGGSRPKMSLVDIDGSLALAKFPRLQETQHLPLGEVLALKMARLAGIDTVKARIEYVNSIPVAIVQRFDRLQGGRKPYISAASLLQAGSQDKLTYLELLDAMRRVSPDFVVDAQQLWRRLVFNLLITNTDDHLQNTGFLYEGRNKWRLAPAFDLNPFPENPRSSCTALSTKAGAVTDVSVLLEHASFFEISTLQAKTALKEVASVVRDWHRVARSAELRLPTDAMTWYEPAFEHEQLYTSLRVPG